MADNSLEDLYAWMKVLSPMRHWDSIVALDGRRVNLGLQQDFVNRLSLGDDLGELDAEIPVNETNIIHYFSAVRLAQPVLSFGNASLQSAKTDLSLAVVAGNLVMMELAHGQKRVIRLSSLNPLNTSRLRLEPTIEADSRNVVLDVANSEDGWLTLFHTLPQQREAGRLFLERLKALSDNKRIYTLAKFPEGDNLFMHSQSIDVRTQKRDGQTPIPGAVNEDGALLFFQSMAEGGKGDIPGNDSGFRFLIPDATAEKTWSGTALFSQALIHRAVFGHALLNLLENAQFNREYDWRGRLTKMVAKSGEFQAPSGSYRSVDYEFESNPFMLRAVSGAQPLTVEFDEESATQSWQTNLPLSFRLRPVESSQWQGYTANFNVDLKHQLKFFADDFSPFGMEGELFTPYGHEQEVHPVSGLPADIDPDLLEQIKDFVAQTIKRALLERFANSLTTVWPKTLLEAFRVVGESNLRSTDAVLPSNLAMFGQINASGSSFSIVAPQSPVPAGKTLQLSTEPVRRDLTWTVENLSDSSSHPGSVNEQGLYQAPPAHALQGTYNRVLAIARAPSGEQSLALITVLSKAITVTPQIQTCFHGERVELSAGHTGKGLLNWSIKNPVPGESGTLEISALPEGDHVYIAGPQVANKTYVLDEIEVKDSPVNESASAWVLAIQREPGATIKLVDIPSLPPGRIQLQALVNGTPMVGEWSLPLGGPGEIDEFGVYRDDPLSKEPFVLIYVIVDGGPFGVFEGHLILPLPLESFPAVLNALAE